MCPVCGSVSHLNVADVADWYRQRYPRLQVCSLVPAKCFMCWHDLQAGDAVVIRHLVADKPGIRPGTRGTVAQVVNSEDGNLYLVRIEGGKEYYFVRSEIRSFIGKEKSLAERQP